jgi:hypothetical protein
LRIVNRAGKRHEQDAQNELRDNQYFADEVHRPGS